jgi:transposase
VEGVFGDGRAPAVCRQVARRRGDERGLREFGISRKTGYKVFNRYKESGFEALSDRCRRPVRYANQLPPQIEGLIVSLKREKPHWGARKIRELLVRRLDQDVRIPAKSTIHAVLHRHGLVKGLRRAPPSSQRH